MVIGWLDFPALSKTAIEGDLPFLRHIFYRAPMCEDSDCSTDTPSGGLPDLHPGSVMFQMVYSPVYLREIELPEYSPEETRGEEPKQQNEGPHTEVPVGVAWVESPGTEEQCLERNHRIIESYVNRYIVFSLYREARSTLIIYSTVCIGYGMDGIKN